MGFSCQSPGWVLVATRRVSSSQDPFFLGDTASDVWSNSVVESSVRKLQQKSRWWSELLWRCTVFSCVNATEVFSIFRNAADSFTSAFTPLPMRSVENSKPCDTKQKKAVQGKGGYRAQSNIEYHQMG
ncbi:UNVERIFIED_CONTAM: hypothetical protein HHA_462360 [Hammondia hammondi]|eukprot:XP_008886011.1 hypothetical protein HHA_462360 [Hammondia hammondi]